MTSRQELYAAGLPLGDSATRIEAGRRVYGGGGGGDSTSSSAVTYPDEIKPLLTNVANLSDDLYNTPFQYYQGPRYAGLSPQQQLAVQGTTQRALQGSPLNDIAGNTLAQMMVGGQQNPYLDQVVGQAQQSVVDSYNTTVKPQLEAAMASSGSFGNSGLAQMQQQSQNQLQQNLGDLASRMYGDAYSQDQINRLQAVSQAPTIANQHYLDMQQLMGAGNLLQDQAQNNLDFAYDQYQQAQDNPFRKLAAMTGVMQGTAGSTTHTTQSGGK